MFIVRYWLTLLIVTCVTRAVLASEPPRERSLQPDEMAPAETASLEAEVVREWRVMHPGGPSFQEQPQVSQERAAAFRKKVRRLFAASPSLTSLALYADAFSANDANTEQKRQEQLAFEAEFAEMRAALTRDFSKESPYPPAFGGLAIATYDVRGARAPAGSLLKRADEVAGWAYMTEPFSSPTGAHGTLTLHYTIGFDGDSFAALAPVYEVAKHLQKNVTVQLSYNSQQETATPLFSVNTAVVIAELPAYAITRHGIVAGKFTRAGFFGGVCNDDAQSTVAEFTFNEPSEDVVLGVFVTGADIDTKRARVQVHEQVFPTFDDSVNGGAITKKVTYTVDLNGDGVPELRGASRRDSEPDSDNIFKMKEPLGWARPHAIPVDSWSADDFDYLDADIAGRWVRLSTYHAVSCD